MLETIDARATVRHAPKGVGGWHYRRSATGGVSFTHPAPPPGVSLCTYSHTPDGAHRVRVEGNLTALLHGPEKACFSLAADEVPTAVEALMDTSHDLLGDAGLPGLSGWDVHRLDPSITYALGDDLAVRDFVTTAHRAFRLLAQPRHVVSLHNDQTATWRTAKWRSVMVYDKGAEARSKGVVPDVDNLLRIEHRIRPRNGSGEWKAMSPNLSQMDELLAQTNIDVMETLGALTKKMSASSQLLIVQALMRGGASVNTALRLASVIQFQEEFGSGVWQTLGAKTSTAERWRKEVRDYLAASGGEDALLDDLGGLVEHLAPALAREHTVTITKKAKRAAPATARNTEEEPS